MIGHPCRSPAFDGIGRRSWNLACFEKTLTSFKINERKKMICDWPPFQVPCIRWNCSQVLKPRRFLENVDHIIGHKFPARKLRIERKCYVIGHPYRSPLFDGSGPRSWNLACFEKTLTSFKINERKKILCDWPPSQVPWIRWKWSQVLKSRLFLENIDHRIGHKFPAWKLTIERKPSVIGHPCRSPLFDGIGPRSWNLACF